MDPILASMPIAHRVLNQARTSPGKHFNVRATYEAEQKTAREKVTKDPSTKAMAEAIPRLGILLEKHRKALRTLESSRKEFTQAGLESRRQRINEETWTAIESMIVAPFNEAEERLRKFFVAAPTGLLNLDDAQQSRVNALGSILPQLLPEKFIELFETSLAERDRGSLSVLVPVAETFAKTKRHYKNDADAIVFDGKQRNIEAEMAELIELGRMALQTEGHHSAAVVDELAGQIRGELTYTLGQLEKDGSVDFELLHRHQVFATSASLNPEGFPGLKEQPNEPYVWPDGMTAL
jgi:hypothetical protein